MKRPKVTNFNEIHDKLYWYEFELDEKRHFRVELNMIYPHSSNEQLQTNIETIEECDEWGTFITSEFSPEDRASIEDSIRDYMVEYYEELEAETKEPPEEDPFSIEL